MVSLFLGTSHEFLSGSGVVFCRSSSASDKQCLEQDLHY